MSFVSLLRCHPSYGETYEFKDTMSPMFFLPTIGTFLVVIKKASLTYYVKEAWFFVCKSTEVIAKTLIHFRALQNSKFLSKFPEGITSLVPLMETLSLMSQSVSTSLFFTSFIIFYNLTKVEACAKCL